MRLTDLDATFITPDGIAPIKTPGDFAPVEALGVRLRCPTPGHEELFLIMFENPIGGLPHSGHALKTARWTRRGNTLDTLTIVETLNALGHFCGHLRNGELIEA